jgi:dTDP-4-dehydrorhamnose reductase
LKLSPAFHFEAGPVWVTGAGGLIGGECVRVGNELKGPTAGVATGLCRADLDLTDFDAVERRFSQERPSAVIHCAAMSKSPACQRDPGAARLNNVEVTRHLVSVAAGVPFVFFSTDLVFDGRKGLYGESDAVNPLSVYAETKVEAEEIVRRHPRHTIVRTSLNFGATPAGTGAFNEEMLAAWKAGRTLDLFVDEYRSPIAAFETARFVWALLLWGHHGVFHVAGGERLSRFEIGLRIADWARRRAPGLATPMRPGSLRDYSGAPRSPDTSLNCAKIEKAIGATMPVFSTWLQNHG